MPTTMRPARVAAPPGHSRSASVRYADLRGIHPRTAEDEIAASIARVRLFLGQLVACGQDARARQLLCELEAELPEPPTADDPIIAQQEADAADDVARTRFLLEHTPAALRSFRERLAITAVRIDAALRHLSREV